MTRDHVSINRDIRNADAANWVECGERLWRLETPEWGSWGTPDEGLSLRPTDMTGMEAIELGCGTGYVSGWMTRRGARVTATDVSAEQLATARRLAADHGAEITFIEGSAKDTGLPDCGFDFAISEYDRPDVFRLGRPFLADDPALVPGWAQCANGGQVWCVRCGSSDPPRPPTSTTLR